MAILGVFFILIGAIIAIKVKSPAPFFYFLIIGFAAFIFDLTKALLERFSMDGLTSSIFAFLVFGIYLFITNKLTKKIKV